MNYYDEIKNELINNEVTKKVKDYSKNKSDLTTYYNVGKLLKEAGKHYGEGIIKEYSEKLTADLGTKYDASTLNKMKKFYNLIKKLLTDVDDKEADYILKEIELSSPESSEYDDEYEIRVCDGEIFCERLKHNCQYILSGADIVYFMDNVNSRVIKSYPDVSAKYEVEIGEDIDDEYNRIHCGDGVRILKDDNGDMHGFTFSKSDDHGYSSYSFYASDKATVHDLLDEIADIWNILK